MLCRNSKTSTLFTMARLNNNPAPSTSRGTSRADSLYRDPTPTAAHPPRTTATLSPSPSASFSSDKENREDGQRIVPYKGKGKMPMGPPRGPISNDDPERASKRRKLSDRDTSTMSPAAERTHSITEDHYYNPDQDQDERREIRIGLRNNARDIHERQQELINGDGEEFKEAIKIQTKLFEQVRQTSDAMIDSRTLVNMSETAVKRTTRIAHGDGSVGVDIDEFVSKCITFMQYGGPLDNDSEEPTTTQARRRRAAGASAAADDDSEDDSNDGDALAWDVLGSRACIPANRRPAVPGFLLGPLSVQKRARSTQRGARLRRDAPAPVQKPQELKAEDLERNEASNLSVLCAGIRERLRRVVDDGARGVDAEATDDMSEAQARAVFHRHGLAMNWEVSLFRFVVNPHSFAQTVENLFYVSFLVKDGFVAVGTDDDGLPTLRVTEPPTLNERRDKGSSRHQAIFSLEFTTWKKLIRAFDIEEPIIAHRDEEHGTQVGSRGWYG